MQSGINWDAIWSQGDNQLDAYLESSLTVGDDLSDITSIVKRLRDGEATFCNEANLESSSSYVNQTLEAFGFEAPLCFQSSKPVDQVKIVNCVYSLLMQKQKDIDFREEMTEKVRRAQLDNQQVLNNQKKTEEKAQFAEREAASLQLRDKTRDNAIRKQQRSWETEKEELSKQVLMLQHRETQFQHELRKKERENSKLVERLQHILSERNREAKAGMEILSSLQREGRKRGNWNTPTKNNDDNMHQVIINAYEAKQKEFISENHDLRMCLRDLQSEMQDLLNSNQPGRKTPRKPSHQEAADNLQGRPGLTQGHFELPWGMARGAIEEHLRAQMSLYRERLSALHKQEQARNDPTALRQQLEEYQKIIQEQDALLQFSLSAANGAPGLAVDHEGDAGDESRVELGRRYLEEEIRLFEEKKSHFEEERRKLTEASIKLAQERMEVQQLKKQLEKGLPMGMSFYTDDDEEFFRELSAAGPKKAEQFSEIIGSIDREAQADSNATGQVSIDRYLQESGAAFSPIPVKR